MNRAQDSLIDGTAEKNTDYFELFVLLCFVLIIILQIVQILNSIYQAIKNFVISRRLAKKQKLASAGKTKKECFYSHPLLVWKKSVEYKMS
jgi:hypothetical protein